MMRVFSAIQPTGCLHLGNYLGAVRAWTRLLTASSSSLFAIADLHALTTPTDPVTLARDIEMLAASLLACGIDPHKCTLFQQSDVPQHAELTWILACQLQMNRLNTMTQFKSKAKDKGKLLGLFTYPVLMTADVLLYKANLVPVGDDQTQHLELARDIAAAFNRNYNVEFFPIPQQLKTNAARVMSLRDGSAKMSKSDPSEFSRIGLIDSYDEISAKIKKAKTDALGSISFDPESRPEVSNLVQIFAELSNQSVEQVCLHFESKNTVEFKNALTELLVEELAPIRKRIIQHQSDMTLVKQVLRNGKEKAAHIAEANMNDIKKIIGLN